MKHLELPEIQVSKGTFSLKVDQLSIEKGEHLAVLGKNGAGKSTYLSGLRKSWGRDHYFLSQESFVVELLSVFHNVYSARLDEHSLFQNFTNLIKPNAVLHEQIEKLLKEFGLTDKIDILAGKLSGGEKRKMNLARAIFSGESFLLADEPLNAIADMDLEKSLNALTSRFENSIVVLHQLEFVSKFQKVLLLDGGEVKYFGPPKEEIINKWLK